MPCDLPMRYGGPVLRVLLNFNLFYISDTSEVNFPICAYTGPGSITSKLTSFFHTDTVKYTVFSQIQSVSWPNQSRI